MHNREDEQIALDAKCPDTVDMFVDPNAGTYTADAIMGVLGFKRDKCIADDFLKDLHQAESGPGN